MCVPLSTNVVHDLIPFAILENDSVIVEKLKKMLQEKYPMIYLQMEDSYNIFQVKNKEGVKSTGPKVDFIMDDYRTNIWNSDLLEKVEVWDKDLEVEN